MKVVLPDSSELELPDGATGLDAARAIGPKLAEQAVLARVDGTTRDLRLPLADGEHVQFLTTRDTAGPRRAVRPAPLDRAPARGSGHAPPPGREDRDRPADRRRLLLRLRVPRADLGGRPRGDRGRDPARDRRGARVDARGGLARGGDRALRGGGAAVQGRARPRRRGRDLALHAGRVHGSLPRPAPPERRSDQGREADEPRGRVLARRREEHAAHADLRHRVLLAGRPRRPPRAARAGARARPSPARRAARPLPPLRPLSGLAVLAPEGDGALERARGSPPPREPRAAATSR